MMSQDLRILYNEYQKQKRRERIANMSSSELAAFRASETKRVKDYKKRMAQKKEQE